VSRIALADPARCDCDDSADHHADRWFLGGAAGAATVGVVANLFLWREWDALRSAPDNRVYDQHSATYDALRLVTAGAYAVAIGAAITGYVLRRHRDAPVVSASVGDGTAALAVTWQR
jgi:hypothetical protein